MKEQTKKPYSVFLSSIAVQCRRVAASVIAGPWPGKSDGEITAKIAALPKSHQAFIVSGVLLMLFLFSLFAAQFGWLGLALYFLAVILIIG